MGYAGSGFVERWSADSLDRSKTLSATRGECGCASEFSVFDSRVRRVSGETSNFENPRGQKPAAQGPKAWNDLREAYAIDRREVARNAHPVVPLVIGCPERSGGAAEREALARFIDVQCMPEDEVVGVVLRKPAS